jgi:hypothetical protein
MSSNRDPLAEALFDAGRSELPSAHARTRTLSAMSVSPVASKGDSGATSPKSRKRHVSRRDRGKHQPILALGVVAMCAAAALVLAWRRSANDAPLIVSEPPPAVPAASSSSAPSLDEPAPTAEPSAPPPPRSRTPPTSTSASPAPVVLTLAEEISALDSVRERLRTGDAEAALKVLDSYEGRQQPRRLGNEAVVLRIEALVRAGRRADASVLAQRFIEKNPNSPLADRARALTSAPANPATDGGNP